MPIPKGLVISLGVGLGAQLLSALFSPKQKQPEVDLSVQKSQAGSFIPIVYKEFRLAGNVVWAPPIKKRRSKKRSKKQQSYTGSAFVLLCEGPIHSIPSVWLNKKRVDENTGEAILGTGTQGRIGQIEATEGTSNSFGFRYRAGYFVEDLGLTDYGERLPQIECEVRTASGNVTLAQVVADILQRVGYPAGLLELSALNGIVVAGAVVRSQTSAANFLSELRQVYFFDLVRSRWKTKAILLSNPPPGVQLGGGALPFSDPNRPTWVRPGHFGAYEYRSDSPSPYQIGRVEDLRLPSGVTLTYYDKERNYEPNTAVSQRDSGSAQNDINLSVPVVLTPEQAQQAAQRLNNLPWVQRRTIKTTLSAIKFADLEVGDKIRLRTSDGNDFWQITKLNKGANFILEVEARFWGGATGGTSAVFAAPPTANPSAPLPQPITNPATATLQILDIPLVTDTQPDHALPVIVSGANWAGTALYLSRDNGLSYQLQQAIAAESTYGTTLTALLADTAAFDVLDNTSVLRVQLANGELNAISEARMRNGENVALVGNEIIRFQTPTLVSPGVYDVSLLLRGRRGTEWARSGHAIGERFILLAAEDLELDFVQLQPSDLGQSLRFKALVSGQELDDVAHVTLAYAGVGVECYAPANLAATRDNAGNITLTAIRRDRRAGDQPTLSNPPLSEQTESYEVEIRNVGDTATVRTLTGNTPRITYTSAQQIADFGVTQLTLRVRWYQLSALAGRGYMAAATISLGAAVAATPQITDFSPRNAAPGETIHLVGLGFTGATQAQVNGVNQAGLVVSSDTRASFVVQPGATTGPTSIVTPGGTATSTADLVIGATGVTSVGLTAPAFLDVTGSPITMAGTIALTLINQAANRFFAGPASGVDATPTFRALAPDDFGAGSVGGFLRKDAGGVMTWATPAGGGGGAGGGGILMPVRPVARVVGLGRGLSGVTLTQASLPLNQTWFYPFVLGAAEPWGSVAFTVNAGFAGGTIHLSIYSNQKDTGNNDGIFERLSTLSFTTVAGAKSDTFTGSGTAGLIYWLGIGRSGATGTLQLQALPTVEVVPIQSDSNILFYNVGVPPASFTAAEAALLSPLTGPFPLIRLKCYGRA